MTVFIVIHRSIHHLSLETNKTNIILYLIKTNKYMYSNTELADIVHVMYIWRIAWYTYIGLYDFRACCPPYKRMLLVHW